MKNDLLDRVRSLNKDIVVKKAEINDGNNFIELMNKQYIRKRSIDYFNWMFFKNDLITKLYCAYHKEKLIGFYGVRFQSLSNNIICGFTVDLLIDENYRNRGIFLLLEEEVTKVGEMNNTYVFAALPNLDGMKAHTGLNTWKNLTKIDTYIYDCNKGYPALNKIDFNLHNSQPIFFLKDESFRNWRYKMNPIYKYSIVELETDVFAVTKIFEDKSSGVNYGDIVDFECNLNNYNMLRELILKACNYLINQNVKYISIWALTPNLIYCLKSLGFYSEVYERYFCIKVMEKSNENLLDIKNWHLVQADSEIY